MRNKLGLFKSTERLLANILKDSLVEYDAKLSRPGDYGLSAREILQLYNRAWAALEVLECLSRSNLLLTNRWRRNWPRKKVETMARFVRNGEDIPQEFWLRPPSDWV